MRTTSMQDLVEIRSRINAADYELAYLGLRVMDEGYEGYDCEVGDIAPDSHVWNDGEWTDETIEGACAIDVARINERERTAYIGRKVWLIGGDSALWGQDAGEIIIRNAVILAIFDI